MGSLLHAGALVVGVMVLFLVLSLQTTWQVSSQSSVATGMDVPAGEAPPHEAVEDVVVGPEPAQTKRPRGSLRPMREDRFHMVVDGKRRKIPFGTVPGTEVVGAKDALFEGDPTPRGCPHSYFTFVNNFGAHNNQLLTLLNAFAVARNLSRTLVLPPFLQGLTEYATRRVIKPDRFYNFTLFKESGFCFVTTYSPHMGPLVKHAAYHLFRVLPRNMSRPYHLLRPSALVSAEVERTLQRLPERYVAVHRRVDLRNMYACQGPEGEKPGYCHMRLEYINTARAALNFSIGEAFFVGTDNPQVRLNATYIRYQGRLASSHTGAGVVDFWVMTKATLFLGNPASSMSLNVCNVRRTQPTPLDCYGWRWCDDRPLHIAGWPCGSPVEGISDIL
eukprot:GGOE01040824.1.p1 GENE.GGOE01040824.1~~GGOE01040824.1.p1  ORF type:complete len:389 (+),score=81.35 GGOE01040824.1:85-1251(+)